MRTLFFLLVTGLIIAVPVAAEDRLPNVDMVNSLFVVNDEFITAIYHIRWEGETDTPLETTLTIPVQGEIADVQFGDFRVFNLLDDATIEAPEYIPQPCDLSPTLDLGGLLGEGGTYEAPVEALDYEIVDGQSVRVTLQLQETAEAAQRYLSYYVHHDSPLILIRYRMTGDHLTVPLNAIFPETSTAIKTNLYVLADTPYTVENEPIIRIDPSVLRFETNQLARTLQATGPHYSTETPRQGYDRLAAEAMDSVEGREYLLPYVNTADHVQAALSGDTRLAEPREFLTTLLSDASYLTRLYTRYPPSQNPVLVPAPDAPHVTTDLAVLIDPVFYHGCTSELLYNPELESLLPANRVYVDDLRAYVPLPDGWKLFDFREIYAGVQVSHFAAAPEELSDEEASRLATGNAHTASAPVLGLAVFSVPYRDNGRRARPDIDPFPIAWSNAGFAQFPQMGMNGALWFWPHPDTAPISLEWQQDESAVAFAHGVKIRMLAPYEDYLANAALYDAMVHSFSTFQFFTHPDLRHTLFLGTLENHVEIGYPEGWEMLYHPDQDRYILPDGSIAPEQQPYVRIRAVVEDDLDSTLAQTFGISLQDATPIPFSRNGRRGFVRLETGRYLNWVIEYSAPTDQYASVETTLRTMALAARFERYEDS